MEVVGSDEELLVKAAGLLGRDLGEEDVDGLDVFVDEGRARQDEAVTRPELHDKTHVRNYMYATKLTISSNDKMAMTVFCKTDADKSHQIQIYCIS